MTQVTEPEKLFAQLVNDTDWQRASFLANCLEIVRPADANPSVDTYSETVVRKILDDFLLLASLFYNKFRDDLRNNFCTTPDAWVDHKEIRVLMQRALDKISNEWNRVYAAILAVRASQSNAKTREITNRMQPVLLAAKEDVGLEHFLVILQFGQSYSLRFSNYTEGIAALNMPLASLSSPWEWTILWHELAGEKVRLLKNETPNFFVSMYEDVMGQLNENDRDVLENWGFSIDWMEELFEDSFSVFHFPIQFLYVFKNLLERYAEHGGERSRHPEIALRLAVAMSLHLQMKGVRDLPSLEEWDDSIWRETWPELKKESDPRRFREFDPVNCLPKPLQVTLAWKTAAKILDSQNSHHNAAGARNMEIRDMIGNAIQNYSKFDRSRAGNRQTIFDTLKEKIQPLLKRTGMSKKISYSEDQLQLARIEDVVRSMNYSSARNLSILQTLEDGPQGQMIKKLLRGGNITNPPLPYDDMLNIPFDNVDYMLEKVRNVSYLGLERYPEVQLTSILHPMSVGHISYIDSNNIPCLTNINSWNLAAPDNPIR